MEQTATITMELTTRDGKIWNRDFNAPRAEPWRPVFGAKTIAQARQDLRMMGYRVTRRNSGN
jgi:hypothetical protein